MSTGIQWTDETWNPVVGCTRVSAGCDHCYAFELHDKRYKANRDVARFVMDSRDESVRRDGRTIAEQARDLDSYVLPLPAQYDKPFSRVQLMPDRLDKPLHWAKPRKIFVNSMSDLFHPDVPDEFIADVYAPMIAAYWHIYQVLTKRPERRRMLFADPAWRELVAQKAAKIINGLRGRDDGPDGVSRSLMASDNLARWNRGAAPSNVWEGTSVENQAAADERIPHLLATPAAVRFLSCEPLLGRVDLTRYLAPDSTDGYHREGRSDVSNAAVNQLIRAAGRMMGGQYIDWVIFGGESGPHPRPCNIEWIRDGVRQCQAAGVAAYVKQLGGRPSSSALIWGCGEKATVVSAPEYHWEYKLKSRHGSDPEEWPDDLRVREFPKIR